MIIIVDNAKWIFSFVNGVNVVAPTASLFLDIFCFKQTQETTQFQVNKRHVGWRQTVWHLAGYSSCTGFILAGHLRSLGTICRAAAANWEKFNLHLQRTKAHRPGGQSAAKKRWFHNQVKQSTRLHVTVVGAGNFKQLLVLQCVLNSFCIW